MPGITIETGLHQNLQQKTSHPPRNVMSGHNLGFPARSFSYGLDNKVKDQPLSQPANSEFLNTPYVCQECGKRYQTSTGYNLHMRMHSGMAYNCPLCNTKFPYKGNMKRHMKYVHQAAMCGSCQAVLHSDTDLLYHVCSSQQHS